MVDNDVDGNNVDLKAKPSLLILDAGAQYGKLVVRKVRELNIHSKILLLNTSAKEIVWFQA
ncbi:unnamed protein product, partial [Allacma fusca]